ncbi:MAG: hypothetical protein WD757_06785 [Actinomycetota bacterium]
MSEEAAGVVTDGRDSRRSESLKRLGIGLAFLGAALTVVGAFAPWLIGRFWALTIGVNGLQAGDGAFLLVLALSAGLLAGLWTFSRDSTAVTGAVTIAAGIGMAVIGVFDLTKINDGIADLFALLNSLYTDADETVRDLLIVQVGAGVWLVIAGAVASIAGGAVLLVSAGEGGLGPRGARHVAVACAIVAGLVVAALLTGMSFRLDFEDPFAAARERAIDRGAQSNLRNAMAAAKTYFTDGDTYTGFDPEVASKIEPSLNWVGNDPAGSGNVVSINLAEGDYVVMSTRAPSGHTFCIADDAAGAGTTYGERDAVDATLPSDCGTARLWSDP